MTENMGHGSTMKLPFGTNNSTEEITSVKNNLPTVLIIFNTGSEFYPTQPQNFAPSPYLNAV
jgi:hypothetical protein